jgi:Double-stranded RNA binding motif
VGQFECEATVGSETYVGEANNKAEAKMAAAELAFQVRASTVPVIA